jgi:hypothetical protein
VRTRQAQQLIADVLARIDEAGSPKPTSSFVAGQANDLLEWLNQEWADIYAILIDADIGWNRQKTLFQTVSGVDTYGFSLGAWWGQAGGVNIVNAGAGMAPGAAPLVFTGLAGIPGFTAPAGTATVGAGGNVTSAQLTNQGQGLISAPAVTIAGAAGGLSLATQMQGSFWKGAGVDVQISTTQFFPADRFQWQQRDDYLTSDWSWPRRILYDYDGGTLDASGADDTVLKFLPIPSGGYTVRHWWYPAPARMVTPTDVIDGVAGAEVAMILGAAQTACLQTEQFELADRFAQLKAEKVSRIVTHLRDRNNAEAPRARVVRGRTGARGRYRWWGP